MRLSQLTVICALSVAIAASAVEAKEVVLFTDPNLEVAMRQELGLPSGPIHDTDVSAIVTLDLTGRGINSLRGIEYCLGLVTLVISDNPLDDLTPVSKLPALERLTAARCSISDISCLGELSNLKHLYLGGNDILDIQEVARLTKLESLDLSYNPVLCQFDWENERTSDLRPIASLSNLRLLYLECYWPAGDLVDISPLSRLENLESLWLRGHPDLLDLSPLLGLANIVSFGIGDDKTWHPRAASHICEVLSGFSELKFLSIYSLTMEDVACLSTLSKLEVLRLDNCDVGSISGFVHLRELRELYLPWNNLRDISVLSMLPLLAKLDLSHNYDLTDIEALHRLPLLEEADLTQTGLNFTADPVRQVIDDLEARGVHVIYDGHP